MATIRQRSDKWQVQVRRAGAHPVSKTFERYAEARSWVRQQEALALRPGAAGRSSDLRTMTVADLLNRYAREISPLKRSVSVECIRLNAMGRDPIAAVRLAKLSPADIAAYRDRRIEAVGPSTVRRDLGTLNAVDNVRAGVIYTRHDRPPVVDSTRARTKESFLGTSLFGTMS